jgi:hypothetical protein
MAATIAVTNAKARPGLITAAEILTMGYDPDDFDFEQIDGVVCGRKRERKETKTPETRRPDYKILHPNSEQQITLYRNL